MSVTSSPLELPIEFFLAMAWDPASVGPDNAGGTEAWAARDFGPEHAADRQPGIATPGQRPGANPNNCGPRPTAWSTDEARAWRLH